MKLYKTNSELTGGLKETTHLCVAAHQDDVEFMAYSGIAECFGRDGKGFSAVVVTDGGGSPRAGVYADFTDEQMKDVRRKEQKTAAEIGRYKALALLMYPSSEVKDKNNANPVNDLIQIFKAARPETVYTHNFADKHDTHVAVAARVIAAIRALPANDRPQKVYGCEVWRGLDWMIDSEKAMLDCADKPNLAAALMGVFDSQIGGGKRYDAAVFGRRTANAVFAESHGVDNHTQVNYAMDLTPLILNDKLDPIAFTIEKIKAFGADVENRLKRFL